MRTITMTELNQRVSSVTRDVVDGGEEIIVTRRGRAVLRLVPEKPSTLDPVEALIAAGRATGPNPAAAPITNPEPVALSKPIDELLRDEREHERW